MLIHGKAAVEVDKPVALANGVWYGLPKGREEKRRGHELFSHRDHIIWGVHEID